MPPAAQTTALVKTPLCLKNVDSLSKGALSVGAKDFYVVGSYPQNGQVAVPLDVTLKLQFNDIVSKAQGLDSFFFLLNQFTGVTSSIPASCIRSVDDYILQFNVIDCFGDVLEANTAYVLFISQRMGEGEIQTLSSIKGVTINEKAFGLTMKNLVFRTVDSMLALLD